LPAARILPHRPGKVNPLAGFRICRLYEYDQSTIKEKTALTHPLSFCGKTPYIHRKPELKSRFFPG